MKTDECIGGILPLNDEERGMLKYIYTKRLRFLLGVFPGILLANLYVAKQAESWYACLLLIPMELVLIIGITLIYFRRIHSVWLDYKRGIKEAVLYEITQKQYMEFTGQYFVGLNSTKHLFHEVERDVWMQCEAGDTFIIYRTPKAGYYFNSQGRFELL